ncbi:MAG: phosphotransferase [Anaerolineaceae bacterium]|nr:phosphotransferase [Anaerolineaceae bacterium]
MTIYALPVRFVQSTVDLFGAQGQAWLDNLPAFLASLEERWQIHLQPPFELSYNYVAPGMRADGSEVVLKTWLVNLEMLSEMESLRLWDGHGIVRLLEHDPQSGAMLLERLRPGMTLAEIENDSLATRIAAQVMRKLWIPAPPDPHGMLRTAQSWARGMEKLRSEFDGRTGPFPVRLVEAAERLFADLLASAGPLLLLHGDLHHWNILSSTREPWLALDPKGLVGEAEYEPGALLRNRWPERAGMTEIKRFNERRLAILCEVLEMDRQRLLSWSIAQAVLSAWWSYEDHHQVDKAMFNLAEAQLEMLDRI